MSKPALHSEEGKDSVVVVCVSVWYMRVHYMLIDPESRTPGSAGRVLAVSLLSSLYLSLTASYCCSRLPGLA
jgi:hypothetical protein